MVVTSTTLTSSPSRWWQVPRANEAVAGWHVSPLVDVVAYHFSWLFILVPLALAGETHPTDYLALWAIGITTSFVHRHVTMPYVYLDGGVFQAHKPRFTLIPGVLMAGFIASVALQQWAAPAHFFTPLDVAVALVAVGVVVAVWWRDRRGEAISNRTLLFAGAPFAVGVVAGGLLLPGHHDAFLGIVGVSALAAAVVVLRGPARLAAVVIVVGAVVMHLAGQSLNTKPWRTNALVGAAAMVAALWNVWHTPAQKVGILRVYNAKSTAPVDKKVPLWVDRLLVFGWFPFLAALLVDRERDTIMKQGKVVKMYLGPIVDGIAAASPVLYPLGILGIVVSVATFLVYEHRATGLRNIPRLSMATGITLLSASFLVASPLKCYVAYGFSHAIEYIVFVWAFQRRRYAVPLSPRPLLQTILQRGALFYGLFIGVVAMTYFVSEFGRGIGLYEEPIRLFGLRSGLVIYVWAIWHSFAHFYFDGFLWKMRPAVRAAL
jgi:hypothetical protein